MASRAKRKKSRAVHGSRNSATAAGRVESDRWLDFGFWAVAFIDLLGQQRAFLRTDRLPEPEQADEFRNEVIASLAVVGQLRNTLKQFRRAFTSPEIKEGSPLYALSPPQRAKARELLTTNVRVWPASDGVVIACPLKPAPGHAVPIHGVYDMLATSAAVMMLQLAVGRPIRGGIDVGTGIEVKGELFGAALVKSYQAEAKRARHPRIVVGKGLMNYLGNSTKAPGLDIERALERSLAGGCLQHVATDSDGEFIVDYAGEFVLKNSGVPREMMKAAYEFVSRSRDDFAPNGQLATAGEYDGDERQELFRRYSCTLRYLESRGIHRVG